MRSLRFCQRSFPFEEVDGFAKRTSGVLVEAGALQDLGQANDQVRKGEKLLVGLHERDRLSREPNCLADLSTSEQQARCCHSPGALPARVVFHRCVHRAEIMQLEGAWPEALEEARRAGHRFAETRSSNSGLALYRQGELYRLQGEFEAAEAAYRDASRSGWEPHPGLAQLRLAQGRKDAAAAAIRRAAGEIAEPLKRAGLLAAYAEIMLAVHDLDDARDACRELGEIAGSYERGMLAAMVEQTRERSIWPGARRDPRWSRFARRGDCGMSSMRRTRRLGRECSSGSPAAPSATTTRLPWNSRLHAASSRRWEQRRISVTSTR